MKPTTIYTLFIEEKELSIMLRSEGLCSQQIARGLIEYEILEWQAESVEFWTMYINILFEHCACLLEQ